jgi:hypothetical protein
MTESEEQGVVSHLVHSRIARFWLRELPYIIVLALTIFGVAYTSVSHQPLIGYWQFLAVAVGLVCVTTGWLHIHDPKARFRMIWRQALHWLAFLVAMNIVLLANVQLTLTATATGLTLLMLLALGTFVAGVYVSWQICVLGIIMGLLVPAIAWLTQSALLLLLSLAAVIGIGMTPRSAPELAERWSRQKIGPHQPRQAKEPLVNGPPARPWPQLSPCLK